MQDVRLESRIYTIISIVKKLIVMALCLSVAVSLYLLFVRVFMRPLGMELYASIYSVLFIVLPSLMIMIAITFYSRKRIPLIWNYVKVQMFLILTALVLAILTFF